MASLSFTGQENTIHGMFHTYTHQNVFLYSTGECLFYLFVYYILAVWTYGIRACGAAAAAAGGAHFCCFSTRSVNDRRLADGLLD